MIGLMRGRACSLVAAVLLAGCSATVVDGKGATGTRHGTSRGGPSVASADARFTDSAAVSQVFRDARHDVEVINTYDYRSLPQARAAGLAVTTGRLRAQFMSTFDELIAKRAPTQRFIQSAKVDEIGLGPATADRATLLMYGHLDITNKQVNGRKDPFAARVDVRRVRTKWLMSRVVLDGSLDGVPPGTAGLADATAAVRKGTAYLLSFRRANFEADFARALAITTGDLRADVVTKKALTRRTLDNGALDLDATVRAAAVASASGRSAVFLVSINGYRVKDGKRGKPVSQHLAVTVSRTGTRWLLSHVTQIG